MEGLALSCSHPQASSLALITSGPAFPTASSERWGLGSRGEDHPCTCATSWHTGSWASFSILTLGAGSSLPCQPVPSVLICPGKVLSQVLQLGRDRDCSCIIMTPRLALLTASGGKGQEGKGHLLATPRSPHGKNVSGTTHLSSPPPAPVLYQVRCKTCSPKC